MSHPDGFPDLFLDRSLGQKVLPARLREAGLRLTTLAERYPGRDERVADEEWLREAGERGEVVWMKDQRIRYRTLELQAVIAYRVRCFCLANGQLTAEMMGDVFLHNLSRIVWAARHPGPFIYMVYANGIRRLELPHE